MRSLSEDEASPGGSSCDDSDAAAEDAGNLSDPGVGPGASGRVRARTRTRTRTRSRGSSVSLAAAAAAKRDDLRLRRQAVVERSRRETRMAVPCRPGAARRLWEGEREGEELWREGEEGRRRVGEVLGREGEGGWAELVRFFLRGGWRGGLVADVDGALTRVERCRSASAQSTRTGSTTSRRSGRRSSSSLRTVRRPFAHSLFLAC